MIVTLAATDGPHAGLKFTFDRRDTFLVGRSKDAHFQLPANDPYFSRRHFVIEVNPPRVRLLDLDSRNGVLVNGMKMPVAELNDGDEITAGHTTFRVSIAHANPDSVRTVDVPTYTHVVTPPNSIPRLKWGAPPDEPEKSVGRIPGYELHEELGRGGMGIVYRATRKSDGQVAAVKVLIPPIFASEKQVEKFLREARILGDMTHPNIVQFYDAGEIDEVLYIAMEFVDGRDAQKMIEDKGPLPIQTAVRLVIQVAAALSHAHAVGYVHRDVKPSNLVIGGPKKGRVAKLTDFGLARAYESSNLSGLTMNGEVGGTPAFMPPEQVTHYRDVKPAGDQYSLSATLYYLLTGKYVYDFPQDLGRRLITILTAPAIPIQERRPDVPEELAKIIHKGLSKEAHNRHMDVKKFRAELKAFA